MKKTVLSIIAILMLLTGCGKKIAWEDVQDFYLQAEKEVENITKDIEVITKDDYKALLIELGDYIDEVEYSKDQNNQDLLKRTYKVAQYIETFASLFDGNCAQKLLSLAINVKDLVKANYDGEKDDFNSIKANIQLEIEEISSWADEEWSTLEKKALIVWNDVKDEIETVEQEAENNLVNIGELAEYQLDELKHIIIDNYQVIANGVTEDTDAIAKEMYAAAVQLEEYADKAKCEEAEKVEEFAEHTKTYIEQCYGKVLESSEMLQESFDNDIASAKKWTQSTWNAITRELQLLVMPKEETPTE